MITTYFRAILICALIIFILVGCNNEADLGPQNEEFFGTYMARDLKLVEDAAFKDSVIFTVIRNTTYSMLFYDVSPGGDIEFCSCEGTILDFGTAKASFDPTNITYTGQCSNRLPRGLFSADFINVPGEIHIEKRVQGTPAGGGDAYDSLYQLILIQ